MFGKTKERVLYLALALMGGVHGKSRAQQRTIQAHDSQRISTSQRLDKRHGSQICRRCTGQCLSQAHREEEVLMVKVVLNNGQYKLTIPKELAQAKGWTKGTILRFVEEEQGNVSLKEMQKKKE